MIFYDLEYLLFSLFIAIIYICMYINAHTYFI